MKFRAHRALGSALFAALTALPASAQQYDVTNLDLGGGSSGMQIAGINAQGAVAGAAYNANGAFRAFFATPTTGVIDIGSLGSGYSQAYGINAAGQVVGFSFAVVNGEWVQHAFVWSQAGGIVDLGTLGGRWSSPYAINDAGTVVGVSEMADGTWRAFGWNAQAGMYALDAPPGGDSYAVALNASGHSVGTAWTGYGASQAMLWNATGVASNIGGLSGANESHAYRINDAGQVMGMSKFYDGSDNEVAARPFFYTQATGIIDMGTLGGTKAEPRFINRQGRVAGASLTANNAGPHAFTWTLGGGMTALTLGGAQSFPTDINATGQVVGWGHTANGATRGFSWTEGGGIVDVGTFGGSSSAAYGATRNGQVIGRAALPSENMHAFLFENGQLKDLNHLVANKPAELELLMAALPADNGSMLAITNTGWALLSPSAGGPAPPVVAPISANDPVAVNALLSVSVNFTDAATDTHTATWTFGDGSPAGPGAVNEANGSGMVSGSHTYAAAGVYPVVVTVTDNGGLKSNVTRNVVVYDPSAGFVTGSGWIPSPVGAYKPDIAAAGPATFSFVSRYQKGAKTPTGTTDFRFSAVGLDFYSDTYEWLVVAGARAQFKGEGTLNGTAGHRFLLTAIDGKVSGGGGIDRFRIKIWKYDETLKQDVIVYDNQLDPGTEGTTSEGTAIGAGQIVIHAPKG